MRTVFRSNSEVCHIFAQGTHPEGRAGNVYFNSDWLSATPFKSAIYSYGSHFVLGALSEDGRTVVINSCQDSPTTGRHRQDLRSAVRHLRVIEIPMQATSSPRPDISVGVAERIAEYIATARRRRSAVRAEADLREAKDLASAYNEIVDLWNAGQDLKVAVPNDASDTTYAEMVAKVETKRKEQAEAIAAAERAREERRLADLAEAQQHLEIWKSGKDDHRTAFRTSFYDLPVALRLSPNAALIETSHGAVVPSAVARRLWPLVRRAEGTGQPYYPPAGLTAVGNYSLREIRGDGTLVVGCHQIPFSELLRIAELLQLDKEVFA